MKTLSLALLASSLISISSASAERETSRPRSYPNAKTPKIAQSTENVTKIESNTEPRARIKAEKLEQIEQVEGAVEVVKRPRSFGSGMAKMGTLRIKRDA